MDQIIRQQWGPCDTTAPLRDIWGINGQLTAGVAAAILVTESALPKLPGNPALASTYPYQVMYALVPGKTPEEWKRNVGEAARYMEGQGARFITAGCSELACCQREAGNAVSIPVYLSALCEIPWVLVALGASQTIGIITQNQANITRELLADCGADPSVYDRCVVADAEGYETFASLAARPSRYHAGNLRTEILKLVRELQVSHPELGAILIECPDVMPFAADIQAVTNLPVFDTVSLTDYMQQVVCKKHYYGYF